MSFSGVFAIGLSGINAFATGLEAVSDNIANTQTTGFKRVRTDFSDLITAKAPSGGINGGGASAVNRQLITEQGAITRTNSETDLAVSGDGFFVVSESATGTPANEPLLFTRAGGFTAQADGTLMNDSGFFLRAAPVASNGAVALGGLSALETVDIDNIPSLAAATSTITLAGNIDANAATGASVTQNFQIFDTNGAARQLALSLTNAGTGQWNAVAAFTDGARETVATGSLVFGANGLIDPAASSFPATLTIAANAGQTIDVNLASLSHAARATQFTTATANGAAAGSLTGVEISKDGRIAALFSNGLSRDIYQIALANFVNADGLDDGPASTFSLTSSAGDLSLEIPQTGRAGAIESAALEISTVDIGQEFSTLIQTQRAYSANTRVITVADELWRTLTQTAA